MTLEQLYKRNEAFQKAAAHLAEMFPGGNMLDFSSTMIRRAKKIEIKLKKLLQSKTENAFFSALNAVEDEMDDLVFLLDRLDEKNTSKKVKFIVDFIKQGYELLSLYSLCCDQLIEQKVANKEEF